MASVITPSIPRFLEHYEYLKNKYPNDPEGFRQGLPFYLKTMRHFDPEKEIAACVEAKDWKRLNDLFFQLNRESLLPGASGSGYDHSGRFWGLLDMAACEGMDAVRRYLSPELGLATNGFNMYLHGMNLLLCLLYCKGRKAIFDVRKVLEDAERFTQTKQPVWNRSVIQFLICLYEDRPAGMRNAMRDVCAGYQRADIAKFKKMQCVNAYGLVVLAREFAPEEVYEELYWEEAKGFSLEYLEWRLGQKEPAPELYLPYPEPAEIANAMLLAEPGPMRIAQLKRGNPRASARDQKLWFEDGERMKKQLLERVPKLE